MLKSVKKMILLFKDYNQKDIRNSYSIFKTQITNT
jgi:hypothetical protein